MKIPPNLNHIQSLENTLLQAADEARISRSNKMVETELYQDSSDEDMYESSDDDDEDDDDDDDAPSRHRLEWDDGL